MMAKKSTTADLAGGASAEGPSFEDALRQLEQIVHDLEEGQIGLDDALRGAAALAGPFFGARPYFADRSDFSAFFVPTGRADQSARTLGWQLYCRP